MAEVRTRGRARLGTLAALTCAFAMSGAARATTVEVLATGLEDTRGHVRVELCTRRTFLTSECPYIGTAPSQVGATTVRIANVPPGEYAIQAYQDESDAGHVHQGLLGIPKERIGFSNDAPLRLRGPRFSDAAFFVQGELQRVTLRLRHLFRR